MTNALARRTAGIQDAGFITITFPFPIPIVVAERRPNGSVHNRLRAGFPVRPLASCAALASGRQDLHMRPPGPQPESAQSDEVRIG